MKSAQGLPITTIVIAALALVVLVILFAITTGRMGTFAKIASECPGDCATGGVLDLPEYGIISGSECREFQKPLRGVYRPKGEPAEGIGDPITCEVCCVTYVG